MKKKKKCWELFDCEEKRCPVYELKEPRCWLVSGTHCRNELQGVFMEKIEMCVKCEAFMANMDLDVMEQTMEVMKEQITEFRRLVDERDAELEKISLELALGLSEAFEALRKISSGDPAVRIPESSDLELIGKLKHMINLTAENFAENVQLSHEFAIGLAEHFDTLHRVSRGDMDARITGFSQVELLDSLKKITNEMIESVSKEISDRERAEQALMASQVELRASEEKYHTLFDYDPNSIFVLETGSFKILDVNARCLEVYGYERDELIGMSFMDLGASKYSDGVLTNTKPTLDTLCSVYPQVQHHKITGEPFYVNVYACQSGQSEKFGIVATSVDITASLAKETQLIQASKMSTLGEMATGVAHELNQPLSTIQIGTDFFQNMIGKGQEIPRDELALVSQQMAEQVVRAVGIIKHLREFGRKTEIQRETIDVNRPISGVFTLLGQQLKLRGIEVVLDLKENLPPIMGDNNRLEQVFIDIVINARDALVEKKRDFPDPDSRSILTFRSFMENDRVVVTISDTGPGIPEEIKDKIFEPFFTTKDVGEGTGLGLSIGYGIVKDYNGTIEVESEVGKGTTFKLSFPAKLEEIPLQ